MLLIFAVKFEKWIFCIFFFMMADHSLMLQMTPYCIPYHGYRFFTFATDDD